MQQVPAPVIRFICRGPGPWLRGSPEVMLLWCSGAITVPRRSGCSIYNGHSSLCRSACLADISHQRSRQGSGRLCRDLVPGWALQFYRAFCSLARRIIALCRARVPIVSCADLPFFLSWHVASSQFARLRPQCVLYAWLSISTLPCFC